MDRQERMRLINALITATNRFNDSLRDSGYRVSYSSDISKPGVIFKCEEYGVPYHDFSPVGELIIAWKIKDSEVNSKKIIEKYPKKH